jgi:hypothetical protein
VPTKASGKAVAATSVSAFLQALDHPLKPEILALRELILAVDPSIGEAIKWNAPSFYTSEHFATMRLHPATTLQLILHLGAKKRDTANTGIAVADPDGLLTWLAKDRASVTIHSLDELEARAPALSAILRQWMAYV